MSETTVTYKPEDKVVPVHKKWMQTTGKGGFVNVEYWPRTNRVVIDIGTTQDNKLISSAKCYVKAYQFLAYLEAEVNDTVDHLYPDFFSEDPKKVGVVWYGGTGGANPVARVFKSQPWYNDQTGRAFKCGWFEGEPKAKGAISPIYSKELRKEQIKMTMVEIAELYQALKMTMLVQTLQGKVEEAIFEDEAGDQFV